MKTISHQTADTAGLDYVWVIAGLTKDGKSTLSYSEQIKKNLKLIKWYGLEAQGLRM